MSSPDPAAAPPDKVTAMDYFTAAALTGLLSSSRSEGMSSSTIAEQACQIAAATVKEVEEYNRKTAIL